MSKSINFINKHKFIHNFYNRFIIKFFISLYIYKTILLYKNINQGTKMSLKNFEKELLSQSEQRTLQSRCLGISSSNRIFDSG